MNIKLQRVTKAAMNDIRQIMELADEKLHAITDERVQMLHGYLLMLWRDDEHVKGDLEFPGSGRVLVNGNCTKPETCYTYFPATREWLDASGSDIVPMFEIVLDGTLEEITSELARIRSTCPIAPQYGEDSNTIAHLNTSNVIELSTPGQYLLAANLAVSDNRPKGIPALQPIDVMLLQRLRDRIDSRDVVRAIPKGA